MSHEIKLCLLGDAGVGKSSIVLRFVSDSFVPHGEATIGASFMSKTLILDDKTYKYQIWDTAGQEKYRGLAPMYYRGAAAAIVVYDITRAASFEMVKTWVRELRSMGPQDIIIAIAGNKLDLEDSRQVATADAKSYADSIGAIHIETSALTAANVPKLFEEISRALPLEALKPATTRNTLSLSNMTETSDKKKNSGGWCVLL